MGECGRGRVISPEETAVRLDEKCILCMSLGMSYTDYWEGENCLPSFFIQAYNQRRKRELEEANFRAWLNGSYNELALEIALHNAFSGKNSPRAEYPDKPPEIFQHEKTEKEKIDEQEQARLRVKIALDNFVAALSNGKEKT